MKSRHHVHVANARHMTCLQDDSIDLVVTSPPYPMIEMWDAIMGAQNPAIKTALDQFQDSLAFELMHKELDTIWAEVIRIMKPGGIACINIGDATRTIDGLFKLYPNHSRITEYFLKNGLSNLPNILWRKQTNAPNKFMGSGMLPVGAYVTLEHEYILIFRKGQRRNFKSDDEKAMRQQSAFFWEERNSWFSDLWDMQGTTQKLNYTAGRERSAAYPIDIPYRLINMFSVKGDLVLDPFIGTGTTTLAAMAAARNSVGFDIDSSVISELTSSIDYENLKNSLNSIIQKRLANHVAFVEAKEKEKGNEFFKYQNALYQFPVMTNQETTLVLNLIKRIGIQGNTIEVEYIAPPAIS